MWWLFLPALVLLGFALWQRTGREPGPAGFGEPEAPRSGMARAPVAGWSGRVELAAGLVLALRLEALHRAPERQAFDASALAARFRAGGARAVPGAQPWRLVLEATALDPTRDDVVIDDLAGVEVAGLEPLVPPLAPAEDGAVVDPLVTLLGFPVAPLRAGEACDLVLWGPRPGAEVAVRAPGVGEPVVLRLRERSTSGDESEALARLDARDGGDASRSRSR